MYPDGEGTNDQPPRGDDRQHAPPQDLEVPVNVPCGGHARKAIAAALLALLADGTAGGVIQLVESAGGDDLSRTASTSGIGPAALRHGFHMRRVRFLL